MKSKEFTYKGMPYHIRLRKKDVGKVAIIVGDPDRVPIVASKLKDAREIGRNREFLSYGGYIGSQYVVVISTGIGGPAVAIVVEELARLGVKTIVRVGTCGSLKRGIRIGSVVIAEASVRLEGTTKQYITECYPAAATPELTMDLKESAGRMPVSWASGIAISTDSFYREKGRVSFRSYEGAGLNGIMNELIKANAICIEMETSVLFTLGRMFGLETGAVLAVIDDSSGEIRADAGVEDAIGVAIGGIRRFGIRKQVP